MCAKSSVRFSAGTPIILFYFYRSFYNDNNNNNNNNCDDDDDDDDGDMRWRSWLKHCATSLKVAGFIPNGYVWIFH